MKKITILAMAAMLSMSVAAQSDFTLNTRAWSTNYWTTTIYDVTRGMVGYFLFSEGDARDAYFRIVPDAALTFPVGIEKEGFAANDIYGPYHRAFGSPFSHPGDYGIGLDASWKPGVIGVYAGAFIKSQELCFRNGSDLRSLYVQPRAGLMIGQKGVLEAGVYYDKVIGAYGNYNGVNKNMFLDGLGLDFSLMYNGSSKKKGMITFMMPLHNFLNEDYVTGEFNGMKRRVGYIMLTQRISF